MLGMFICPHGTLHSRVDRDFGIVLQDWALLANNTVPTHIP